MEFVDSYDPNDPGAKIQQPINYLHTIFKNVNKEYGKITCENANDYIVLVSINQCPVKSKGAT